MCACVCAWMESMIHLSQHQHESEREQIFRAGSGRWPCSETRDTNRHRKARGRVRAGADRRGGHKTQLATDSVSTREGTRTPDRAVATHNARPRRLVAQPRVERRLAGSVLVRRRHPLAPALRLAARLRRLAPPASGRRLRRAGGPDGAGGAPCGWLGRRRSRASGGRAGSHLVEPSRHCGLVLLLLLPQVRLAHGAHVRRVGTSGAKPEAAPLLRRRSAAAAVAARVGADPVLTPLESLDRRGVLGGEGCRRALATPERGGPRPAVCAAKPAARGGA
ncbi:hypothetical protein EMIHUDRAFT_432295, partial [Emiliania huxleyi CCMP1516]|uniref:Uncharacterized protein n=2 Tax=Emiliania huxleyi TaxID=2903 RepID=A0A0D3J3R9_EMIH1